MNSIKWEFAVDDTIISTSSTTTSISCTDVDASAYCSRSGDTGYGEYITRVQFEGIDKSSGADSYADYTYLISNSLSPGSSYTVSVEMDTGGYIEYITVYIDWNQDGDLSDANEDYKIGSCSSNGCVVSDSISVPSGAVTGSTLMRVAQEYNEYPSGPCSQDYGDTEDYTACIG